MHNLMKYIALRPWKAQAGLIQPGNVVEEARSWRNPGIWVKARWVKEVPDNEVIDGRWIKYNEFIGAKRIAGASKPIPKHVHETAPKPVPKIVKNTDKVMEVLQGKTKEQLLAISGQLGLSLSRVSRKNTIIEKILEHGDIRLG